MSKLDHQRSRDEQAWIFDWVVKETGRVQNFEYDKRELPKAVKSYAMIPKHMGRQGLHRERVARAAERAGHSKTAIAAYKQAVNSFHTAQHCIHADDNAEKLKWYGRMAACFERIMALSDQVIERVEVPWGDHEIQVAFSPVSTDRRSPCVLVLPGMDSSKEKTLLRVESICRQRGFNVASMDGPGQGVSNIRKIRITSDNYESAVSSVIDYLRGRTEIDADRIVLLGTGTGSFWTVRSAAHDDRVAAAAAGPSTCFGDVTAAFEQVSPRYKRAFMYMAGVKDEATFDTEVAAGLTTRGRGSQIKCPTLVVQGEFDPMSPLEDGQELFDELAGPKEFWILEDAFHGGLSPYSNLGGVDGSPFMLDWLAEAVVDGFAPDHARIKWIDPAGGSGPYDDPV